MIIPTGSRAPRSYKALPAGNSEKYKEKAVLAISTMVRYKESL